MEENKNNTVEDEKKVQGTGEAVTQPANNVEGEEKKYSQEEAQKMADAIVAKKLKGMPSKEELKEYNEWKESQKSEEQKKAEAETENMKKNQELEETKKELAVYKAGVNSEEVDFIVFKVSKMEGDFEENLKEFLEKNPRYLKQTVNDIPEKQTTGIPTSKIADSGDNGVAAILKRKHPELYK